MSYYYLNKMNNTYNQYQYQYLDHVEATIDIRQNYWQFDCLLFCINDYKLPPGCLVASLDIPYQEVKDISFNFASDQSLAKSRVKANPEYSHIYESKFNVDVSANQFFNQDINNAKINCSIKLEIDPQVIKNAGLKLDQLALDTLIIETSEQRWDFSMYYSNTQIVSKEGTIDNISGYQLESGHECSNKISLVDVSTNIYTDNTNSINELVTFKSNTVFQILQTKVKFYYWLDDETEQKTLETNLLLDRKIVNEQTLFLNQNTSFDFINNKVVLDTGGIQGFYIPKYSHGYYEIELLLNQNNNIAKFIIRNNYDFKNNINNPHIEISKDLIKDINGWKKVVW